MVDVPSGIILLWSGAVVNIPAGWVLCDGSSGTPDLRNRFVVGSGDTYAVGAEGGTVIHSHPFTGDGHTHTLPSGDVIASGPAISDVTTSSQAAGTTDNGNTLPPYYALAFIMKT